MRLESNTYERIWLPQPISAFEFSACASALRTSISRSYNLARSCSLQNLCFDAVNAGSGTALQFRGS